MREKWKRRGYVKLHITVDVKSKKIVVFEAADECVGAYKVFKHLRIRERCGEGCMMIHMRLKSRLNP